MATWRRWDLQHLCLIINAPASGLLPFTASPAARGFLLFLSSSFIRFRSIIKVCVPSTNVLPPPIPLKSTCVLRKGKRFKATSVMILEPETRTLLLPPPSSLLSPSSCLSSPLRGGAHWEERGKERRKLAGRTASHLPLLLHGFFVSPSSHPRPVLLVLFFCGVTASGERWAVGIPRRPPAAAAAAAAATLEVRKDLLFIPIKLHPCFSFK